MRICPQIVLKHGHNCEFLEYSLTNPQITPALNFVKINPVDYLNKFYTQTYSDFYSKISVIK